MEEIMANNKATDENVRKFKDLTNKSWLQEPDGKIKVGDSATKIMANDCESLKVKEILYGDPANTWRIIITNDGNILLLKTSRELV